MRKKVKGIYIFFKRQNKRERAVYIRAQKERHIRRENATEPNIFRLKRRCS